MRVTSPRRQRHNRVLKATKGFRMSKHRLYKVAHEAARHAGMYAYAGRKLRKRDLRSLWIVRITAALKPLSINYSKFINLMKKSQIRLNRKMLAHLAYSDPQTFNSIVSKTK